MSIVTYPIPSILAQQKDVVRKLKRTRTTYHIFINTQQKQAVEKTPLLDVTS
jgi:hypothetical protein